MSRSDSDLLADIHDAIAAIRSHLTIGSTSEQIVMDAVSMRLLEIGEAVKSLSNDVLMSEPRIRWREISRMRDVLAHHYFAAQPAIVQATVEQDLDELMSAIQRMRARLGDSSV